MTAFTHAVCCGLALLAAASQASFQSRPDFSGRWVVAETESKAGAPTGALALTGIFGETFTAKQTTTTLTLELSVSTFDRPIHVVYMLDGSESKNLNPSPVKGIADEVIFSRAVWDSGKLVIDTRGTRLINGTPQTSRRVLTLNTDGTLTVERTAQGQPPVKSLYRRAGE
jgi:hypothetical protein